jgi:hypothetical protein
MLGFYACLALLASPEPLELNRTDMRAGEVYEFRTTGNTYRAVIVNPKSGECSMSASADGTTFSPSRKTYLLGASRGEQAGGITMVLMGQIKVGQGIEMAVENFEQKHRYITPEVTEIRKLPADSI